MKYETPELTALTSAITAIQTPIASKTSPGPDGAVSNDGGAAYQDWE